MPIKDVITAQTGGLQFDGKNMTNYSMFVGGNNATHHALLNYSPAIGNYIRVFMVRPPFAVLKRFAGKDEYLYSSDNLFIQFKHMMEYMNRGIQGFGNVTLQNSSVPIQGGNAGRQYNIPTVTVDETTEFQCGFFEMNGLPVYTVIEEWMNMIGDMNSGLATYGGYVSGGQDENGFEKRLYRRPDESDDGIPFNEANHTAEFIAVFHDRTGAQVQKALLLADCYPKAITQSALMESNNTGTHDAITYDISFNCVPYRSSIITAIANDLLKQYRIVSNTLNFNPELGDAVYANGNSGLFNRALGAIPVDSATGTNIGNIPAFRPSNKPKTVEVGLKDINVAKLSGQPDYPANPPGVWDGFESEESLNARASGATASAAGR